MTSSELKLTHPPVVVNAIDFRDAVSKIPKMLRAPAGAKGVIPRDTLLSPNPDGIMVETPVMASLVLASAPWRVMVSVDARKLLDVCDRFKKIGALKSKADEFRVAIADGELRIRWQTTTIGIPTW
jgi:hypothetical protein